ncbi:heavy metal transporter [Nostoc linckia z18]|uniref:Heavy metal transporter n=3 Tax=Nostoc linckia TaxID=92942 RepID=A0A9Q5ZG83_NOSLI|nr:heavy metal transporter [Nostoc linckia z1]PHJ71115.1 heavy metal transporter [Nostoc linckia z3]PHJ76554.1 heavy metal transporter [Nostoc linckia z2]PHJ84586.1 heavy metal transporter [Nostoc linckia z4]PHJ91750.1 heavy metal transporter [Nostoc linckia z6]PHJ99474.1 heavy metal transporter [Nostoc linckia z7]PHK06878.1 heavy metal transporter [Nostoc linckia z8]PHK13151.1 heavy metal transporter [Nostoc linckia z9]PHK23425.1 heavy metal transporter [Nostoc linckia z14]PHK26781.1 heav
MFLLSKFKVFNIMTLQLTVPNMACSACGDTITKAVKTVDPTATVQADPKTKIVLVDTNADETVIKEAITTAGYSVT